MAKDALQAQRERIEKLRQQVIDEQAKAGAAQSDAVDLVQQAQLDAEEARLKADLAVAKSEAKAARDATRDQVTLDNLAAQTEAHELRALAATDPDAAAKMALKIQERRAKAATEADTVPEVEPVVGAAEAAAVVAADKKEN